MTPRLPDSVKHGQPHSVRLGRHHQWVTENLKSVLRDNLRALLGLAPGKSGVSALIKLGLSNANAQRALGGETSVGLGLLHLALRACAHRHQFLNPIALSHLASL